MKWHPCNSSLSVKLLQSSGTQWDLTITKNSVLLSYSSPFMDEDKEIVAEFWWPAQEYQHVYPGTKWVEFVFEKYIFPQTCGTSDFLKVFFVSFCFFRLSLKKAANTLFERYFQVIFSSAPTSTIWHQWPLNPLTWPPLHGHLPAYGFTFLVIQPGPLYYTINHSCTFVPSPSLPLSSSILFCWQNYNLD